MEEPARGASAAEGGPPLWPAGGGGPTLPSLGIQPSPPAAFSFSFSFPPPLASSTFILRDLQGRHAQPLLCHTSPHREVTRKPPPSSSSSPLLLLLLLLPTTSSSSSSSLLLLLVP